MRSFILPALYIVLLLAGCGLNEDKVSVKDKVTVYEAINFSEVKPDPLFTVSDKEEIGQFTEAIKTAEKVPGIVDMAEPDYRVDVGKDKYFLWFRSNHGTIMNTKDTHTIFRITKDSVSELNSIFVRKLVSPTFKAGPHTLYGNENRFGLIRFNGEGEDLFNVGKGRSYGLYFWGEPEELKGKYKLIGVHQETGEEVRLYEWDIQSIHDSTGASAQSGGKFGLDSSGLWRLDVYVNDTLFDSIFVNVP